MPPFAGLQPVQPLSISPGNLSRGAHRQNFWVTAWFRCGWEAPRRKAAVASPRGARRRLPTLLRLLTALPARPRQPAEAALSARPRRASAVAGKGEPPRLDADSGAASAIFTLGLNVPIMYSLRFTKPLANYGLKTIRCTSVR